MPDDSSQRPGGARPDDDVNPADETDPSVPAAEGEPTRFRVADTGWPPPPGSVGPTLPRRTPGASGGPGGAGASDADPAGPPDPSAGPAPVRSGWVTSPPLEDEPWAGLSPAARDAEAADPAAPDAAQPSATAGEPAPAPASEPDASANAGEDAARSSGRHRGPRNHRGRPRGRGLRRRSDPAPETQLDPGDAGTGGSDALPEARPPRGHGSRAKTRSTRRSGPSWPVARLGLLALAVVAALVFGVLTLVTRVWPGPAANPYTSSSTRAAIAAATAVAPPILSYNYTTIDQKAAQLAPLQTAACATQYKQLITSTVKPLAVQNKATQQAALLAAGVTSASKDAVTVLAFMQLTSTNSVKTGKEINEAQISVSMVKQHGRWLLAGTSANGAGGGGTPSCGGASPTGK